MNAPQERAAVGAEERELMAERARALAVPPAAVTARELLVQVLVVAVGQQRFGVPTNGLVRMMPTPPITPLPGLPPWMLGVANTTGGVVSVVDLGRWFGVPQTGTTPTHVVLLQGPDGLLALGVEGGGALRDIYVDELAESLVEQQLPSGLPIRATTNDLVTVLDLEMLFASPAVRVGKAHEHTDDRPPGRSGEEP